ncbi:hypothetical protein HIU99_00880 [Marinobacter sp. W62]|uniref:HTH-like domain-containing protein n=1 Tax=Marinobacter orientalis TaxID=1928859 RepID=A0A7Y0NJU1_9GAMM|nr:hypothetical protein [Marinobacter orientalis]
MRIHYGYCRAHVLLQREGWQDNPKRAYRLYREQGLSLRLKAPGGTRLRIRQQGHGPVGL